MIRVRTNVRGEDAYLYRVRMPVSAMRSLFLGYIKEANALVRTPRFYNTITVNCTTLVYQMMKRIVGYLPLNYRLLCPAIFRSMSTGSAASISAIRSRNYARADA